MSILSVEHLSHGFGDRAIFEDVSFRLLKGEHIGLIGANGEGKSTFMSIVTGRLQPDDGKVEWSPRVRAGYLDQHANLAPGMSIRDALRAAFSWLFELEGRMNEICDLLGSADEAQMDAYMAELSEIQELLDAHDFYLIDTKVEEVARALGLTALGLEHDVSDLSGGQRTKVLLARLLLEKPDILLLDEPTNYLDEEHIAWLKRYLQEYENAFILISHDIPFLNEVVNLIYHMENRKLTRYVGNYDKFQEVYAVQKAQLEAAYKRQQQEISELEDFVNRNKARVATRNMAMSRQKKLDKMERIELTAEKPKPEFRFKQRGLADAVGAHQGDFLAPLHGEGQGLCQRGVVADDQFLRLEDVFAGGAAGLEVELRLGLFRGQLDQFHLVQLLLPGHGHVAGGHPGLVAVDELLQLADLLLLALVGGLHLGLLHGVDLLEVVVVAHIAVELLVFHVVDQVDDLVQKRDVMGDQHKGVFVLQQVAFQPGDVLYVQIVGRLVQQQNVRLFQQQLGQQHLGALSAAEIGYVVLQPQIY